MEVTITDKENGAVLLKTRDIGEAAKFLCARAVELPKGCAKRKALEKAARLLPQFAQLLKWAEASKVSKVE